MERKTPDYTVVEVALKIDDKEKATHLKDALEDQIIEYGFAGSELTECFDQVNYIGIVDNGNEYYVNFLAPSHNYKKIEGAIKQFLSEFKRDLKSDEHNNDWVDLLGTKNIPIIEEVKILETRKYDW